MRKALHVHMLIQLHGFSHPEDLITSGKLADVFRRIWYFVASICFRSVEAFADYLNEPEAMEVLKQQPLIPITKKQSDLLGKNRTAQAIAAQKKARDVVHAPVDNAEQRRVRFYVPTAYSNASVGSAGG